MPIQLIIPPTQRDAHGQEFQPPVIYAYVPVQGVNSSMRILSADTIVTGGKTAAQYEYDLFHPTLTTTVVPVNPNPAAAVVVAPVIVTPPVIIPTVIPVVTPPVIDVVNPNPGATPTPTGNPANNDVIPPTVIIPNPGATSPIVYGLGEYPPGYGPTGLPLEPSLLQNPLVQVVLAALGIIVLIKLLN